MSNDNWNNGSEIQKDICKNYFCTVSIFVLSFKQHEDRFRVGPYMPAPSKIRVSQIQEPWMIIFLHI